MTKDSSVFLFVNETSSRSSQVAILFCWQNTCPCPLPTNATFSMWRVPSTIFIIHGFLFLEIVWLCEWFAPWGVKCTTCSNAGNSLWRYSWTSKKLFCNVPFIAIHQFLPFFLNLNQLILREKSEFLFLLAQFYDLEELFRTGGQVPDTAYIFMVRDEVINWLIGWLLR